MITAAKMKGLIEGGTVLAVKIGKGNTVGATIQGMIIKTGATIVRMIDTMMIGDTETIDMAITAKRAEETMEGERQRETIEEMKGGTKGEITNMKRIGQEETTQEIDPLQDYLNTMIPKISTDTRGKEIGTPKMRRDTTNTGAREGTATTEEITTLHVKTSLNARKIKSTLLLTPHLMVPTPSTSNAVVRAANRSKFDQRPIELKIDD
jgi:hypothetical protein